MSDLLRELLAETRPLKLTSSEHKSKANCKLRAQLDMAKQSYEEVDSLIT